MFCNFFVRVFDVFGIVLLIRRCPSLCLTLVRLGQSSSCNWRHCSRGVGSEKRPTRRPQPCAKKIVQPDCPGRGQSHPYNWRHRSRVVGSENRPTRRPQPWAKTPVQLATSQSGRGLRKSSNLTAPAVGIDTRAIGDIAVGAWAQKIVQLDRRPVVSMSEFTMFSFPTDLCVCTHVCHVAQWHPISF
jgi:hypothetical protein